MIGVLQGQDVQVAQWTWAAFKIMPMHFNKALGLVDEGKPVGSILFSRFNGHDVEVSYYGEGTITAGIVRHIGKVAIEELKVERISFFVPRKRKSSIRFLLRLGAVREGNCRRYYGRTDSSEHTAVRLALFRETIERHVYRGRLH